MELRRHLSLTLLLASSLTVIYTCPAYAVESQQTTTGCSEAATPRFIKKIENYDIVAYNTATIATNFAFSGEKLIYSVTAHPESKKNKVTINHDTGEIQVKADAEDNFDVTVTAKNNCGKATARFNVQIDEDKG